MINLTVSLNYFIVFLLVFQGKIEIIEGIVGGRIVVDDQYRYQVAVYNSKQFICGGSIISDNHILSAAHCFMRANNFIKDTYYVTAGIKNLCKKTNDIVVLVKKLYVPREFTSFEHKIRNNQTRIEYKETGDIIVLQLEKLLNLDANHALISKLALPIEQKDQDLNYRGASLTITGFGFNYLNEHINIIIDLFAKICSRDTVRLKMANAVVILREHCENLFNMHLHDKIICAKLKQVHYDQPEGVCFGDSGGPLVLNNTVIGVLSSCTCNCNESLFPSLYTNVYPFLLFIRMAMNDEHSENIRVAAYQDELTFGLFKRSRVLYEIG